MAGNNGNPQANKKEKTPRVEYRAEGDDLFSAEELARFAPKGVEQADEPDDLFGAEEPEQLDPKGEDQTDEDDDFFTAEELARFNPKGVDQPTEPPKEEAPKAKNFFDMDEEDEPQPDVKKESPRRDHRSALFDEGRDVQREINEAFGDPSTASFEDEEDELSERLARQRPKANERSLDMNVLGVNVSVKEKESIREAMAEQAGNDDVIHESDEIFSDARYDPAQSRPEKTDGEIERMVDLAKDDEAREERQRAAEDNNAYAEANARDIEEDDEFGFLSDDSTKVRPKEMDLFPPENPQVAPENPPREEPTQEKEAVEAQDDITVEDDIVVEDVAVDPVEKDPDAINMEDIAVAGDDDPDILGGAKDMIAAMEEEPKAIDDSAKAAVFMEKVAAFGKMYKVNINANNFAFYTNEAWTLMKSGDARRVAHGQKMLSALMKHTLNPAFRVERDLSYNEHRLPDYTEITKSANELMRAAISAFTDLYHDPDSAALFESTAFGGLKEDEIAEFTQGDSLWKMDQKSDEAWEIQSKEAKDIAASWQKEARPFEKMIKEMNALVSGFKENGSYDRREVRLKLAAAEWLLVNDPRMMIEDPEDPINPIPNWGNRYWKTLTQTREALGIDKHTSMRDLIQEEYAAAAKAVNSSAYNKTQIKENVLDPEARSKCDSMEMQKEQFATQSAHATLIAPKNEKTTDEDLLTTDRVQISIKFLDQREIMKNEPKNYDFVVERGKELNLTASNIGQTK